MNDVAAVHTLGGELHVASTFTVLVQVDDGPAGAKEVVTEDQQRFPDYYHERVLAWRAVEVECQLGGAFGVQGATVGADERAGDGLAVSGDESVFGSSF